MASDHDPEGEAIAQSMAEWMQSDFGIKNLVALKGALTAEQVKRFRLPPGGKVKKSKNTPKYVAKHGKDVYELEALRPADLQAVVQEAIQHVIDTDLFNRELDIEKQELVELEKVRRRVKAALAGELDMEGGDGQPRCQSDQRGAETAVPRSISRGRRVGRISREILWAFPTGAALWRGAAGAG